MLKGGIRPWLKGMNKSSAIPALTGQMYIYCVPLKYIYSVTYAIIWDIRYVYIVNAITYGIQIWNISGLNGLFNSLCTKVSSYFSSKNEKNLFISQTDRQTMGVDTGAARHAAPIITIDYYVLPAAGKFPKIIYIFCML